MNISNNSFSSIEQMAGQYLNQPSKSTKSQRSLGSFDEILKSKQEAAVSNSSEETQINQLKFSKHASERLSDRNIELTDSQKERLNAGAQMASEKGIQESLVVVDQLAFIVNVPNSTVVTAIDQESSTQNVFTNIDGAVIV